MEPFVDQCKKAFITRFGNGGEIKCGVAPGRVNLIGEHTDYNEGFVFPMCMPMYTVCIARFNGSSTINVYSATLDRSVTFSVDNIVKSESKDEYWSNFVRGAIKVYREKSGRSLAGFDLFIDTQVPLGGGLSSSASLAVAVITVCEALTGCSIAVGDKALGAQWAENTFANSPCGIMDQWISAHGKAGRAMLLDCRDRTHRLFPVHNDELVFMVINSNVKHAVADSPYAERQSSCFTAAEVMGVKSLRGATVDMLNAHSDKLSELQMRRARHAITEDVRTLAATDALERADFETFGRMMNESHNSLRDDFEVSTVELDQLVDLARGCKGVLGSRMTGGGFGGCTVTLVRRDAVERLEATIEKNYSGENKATFYVAQASDGAKIIDL